MNPLYPEQSSPPALASDDITVRIEALMGALKLKNRGEMAERLGYSRSQLYAIEKGEVPVSRKFLISLEALEKSAERVPSSQSIPETRQAGDPVARLLRGLDFVSLCGVAEAGITKLRHAGKVIPEELNQLTLAVEEIHRRAFPNSR
jgi:transcriptional regulator with XRE-family HTH domain